MLALDGVVGVAETVRGIVANHGTRPLVVGGILTAVAVLLERACKLLRRIVRPIFFLHSLAQEAAGMRPAWHWHQWDHCGAHYVEPIDRLK